MNKPKLPIIVLALAVAVGACLPLFRQSDPSRAFAQPVPVRTLVPVIDARTYGVAASVANNTAALQAALNAAGASGRPCNVVLPGGVLNFTGSTPLSVPSNVCLAGQGRGGTTLRVQAGRSAPLIDVDAKTNVSLCDFGIAKASGAAATGTAYGVYIRGASTDVVVERVTCDALFRPFQVAGGEGTVAGVCQRITLRDCTGINSPQQYGFNLDDVDTLLLDNCYARANGLDGFKLRKKAVNVTIRGGASTGNGTFITADGIDCFAGGDTFEIDGTLLASNTGSGITIKTGDLNKTGAGNVGTYGLVRNALLRNLRTKGNAFYGVYLTISDPADTAEPLVNGCVIDGGYFEGDLTGLYINAHNVSVNHPFIRKTLQHGIVTSSQAFDVELNDVMIVAAGQTTNNTYHGIVIGGSTNVRVNRGLVVGKDADQVHQDSDLTALTAVTRYGCDIQPSSTSIWVNFLRGRQIASNIVNNQVATGTAIIDQLRGGDAEGGGFGGVGSLYRRDYSSIGEDGWRVWKVKTRGAPNSVGGTVGTVRDWSWLVQGAAVSSLPTAAADTNGLILRLEGGAGVADTLRICTKNADGSFSWKLFTLQ
jgi:hypothetical protein